MAQSNRKSYHIEKFKEKKLFYTHSSPDLLCLLRTAAPALEVEHRLPTKTGSGIQQNKTTTYTCTGEKKMWQF